MKNIKKLKVKLLYIQVLKSSPDYFQSIGNLQFWMLNKAKDLDTMISRSLKSSFFLIKT